MTLKKNTWWGVNILFGWFKGRRFYDKTIANDLFIFGILFAKGGSLLEQYIVCLLNVSKSESNKMKCVTNMTVELELEYWRKNIKGHPLVL